MEKNEKEHLFENVLVVGGTSGLGLALARSLVPQGYEDIFVTGTGRKDPPKDDGITFLELDIGPSAQEVSADIDRIMKQALPIDLLIYAAGFFEQGTIDQLGDAHIDAMVNVSFTAPAKLISRILRRQLGLPGLIFITSTSQWIPRFKEPIYASLKSALGMLGKCLALDPHIKKTLVAAPAAMDTPFWGGEKREGTLLDQYWVAGEILKVWQTDFVYKCIRILRGDRREIDPVEEWTVRPQ